MPRLLSLRVLIFFFCVIGYSAAAQSTTVPFRLDDNLIRIPAKLNGRLIQAVLDSGTGGLGIDYGFAALLHLDIGRPIGMVPGGGKPEPMYPVVLDQLEVGPERLTHVSAYALDLSHLTSSAGFPVPLLLGLPVFAQQPIRIDYPARTVQFLPAGSTPACSDPLPFTFVGGAPVVTVTIRAMPSSPPQTLHLIVDLGTRHYAAMLGSPFLDTAEGKALDKSATPKQVGTGTGGAIMGATATVASLTVGSHTFPHLTVALTRHVGAFNMGGAEGSLGVPLWKDGTVTFDYEHKTVCFGLKAGADK